jgi:hypothetical protein
VAAGENGSAQRTIGTKWGQTCQAFLLCSVNVWAQVRSQCLSGKAVQASLTAASLQCWLGGNLLFSLDMSREVICLISGDRLRLLGQVAEGTERGSGSELSRAAASPSPGDSSALWSRAVPQSMDSSEHTVGKAAASSSLLLALRLVLPSCF